MIRSYKSISNHLYGSSFRIMRIEKTLHEEIMNRSGLFGQVNRIYQNGFDLTIEEGRLIHLSGGTWLHCPFGGILDQSPREWIMEGSLKEGDAFWREGEFLIRKTKHDYFIYLKGCDLVDLKRVLYRSPPEPPTLLFWIESLTEQIHKSGKFDGIAGVLTYLCQGMPRVFSPHRIEPNVWSRQAIDQIRNLVHSVVTEKWKDFEKSWSKLLGLGPGLTPSGDDFLVGFLAAHKVLSSSFSGKLEKSEAKRKLRSEARALTVSTAAQFLVCALEGFFSESLYFVFEDLIRHFQLRSRKEDLNSTHYSSKRIADFMKWGHSSGADTLTGVVFGLWTIILSLS